MKTVKILLVLLALTANAYASSSRTLDAQSITNGANTLTLPSATDTLVGKNTTDTLTNKTISGASNTISNLSASSISSGTLGVSNGGTGDTSLTLNGMLYGNGTSAAGVTAAGSQYQVFQAGASGVPTVGALQLNQSAAVSGALGVANGGTGLTSLTAHYTLIGNGTSAATLLAPGTSGYVLTSNGASSDPSWQAIPSTSPSINSGSGSPQSVTAGGGVSLSSITYTNYKWVAGSAGAVTVTATPSVTACTADGQKLVIIGTSDTNTVKLQDQANLASSGLSMNGDIILAKDSAITFHCDITQGLWVEDSRR